MKLYLTSTGFENNAVANYFKTIVLPRDVKDLSFLVISVQDNDSDAFYLQKTTSELNKIGAIDIEVFKLREEKFEASKDYDVIYVCGGNTFVYLDRIRKTGLDKFIVDSVRSDKSIYVGVSAGSIVAGPDIAIAGDEDPNDIELVDLRGLGLTNYLVYPHYAEDSLGFLNDFKKTCEYSILEINDAQAVYLNYADIEKLKDVESMIIVNE